MKFYILLFSHLIVLTGLPVPPSVHMAFSCYMLECVGFFYFFWVALFATSLCSLFSNDWIAQVWLWALAVSGTFTNSVLHLLFEILFNSSFHTVHVKICWCESFILSFVQYHANCCVSEHAEPCDVKNAIKKRKLCSEASGSLEEAVTNGNSSSVSESIG